MQDVQFFSKKEYLDIDDEFKSLDDFPSIYDRDISKENDNTKSNDGSYDYGDIYADDTAARADEEHDNHR